MQQRNMKRKTEGKKAQIERYSKGKAFCFCIVVFV
jgi:hypothetical protein